LLGLAGLAWMQGLARAQQNILPQGQTRAKKRVRAVRIQTPPTIDGRVNEAVWEDVEPTRDFLQQFPDDGQAATEPTEIRIAYDDDNLYFGIICYDSQPDNIVVTQNRRDAPLNDTDAIQILLDTFGDGQQAFIFGTSPTGIEYDGQISKAGINRGGAGSPARAGGQGGRGGAQRGGAASFNVNWDGVWEVRSQITERGWESEMVIPFKTLRYRAGADITWGLNVFRNLRRRNEQSYWSPVSRDYDFQQLQTAGVLEGLDLRMHRSLKLLPFVVGGFRQNFLASEDRSNAVHDAGMDLKYSLGPNMTLDATFNTDFAQVEVDEEQINLTRFDLFFPEKRPFFLENAGIFEFGTPRETEVFFSRRIGIDESGNQIPIDAGARLSGKIGKYTLGFLDMKTRERFGTAPSNNFTVLRVNRELPNRSSIGAIATNRQSLTSLPGERAFNRVFGADANIGLGRYANWSTYVAKSQTPGLNDRDHVFASNYEFNTQNHNVDLGYTEVGRNFNPEVGFVRRAGYRKPNFGYRYTYLPEGGRIRSIFPHFQWNTWYTLETNQKESAFQHYHVDSRWQDGSRLGLAWNRNFERIDRPFEVHPGVFVTPGRYQFSETVLNFETNQSAPLFAGGNASVGDFYGGTIRSLSLTGGVRKGANLTWSGGYTRNYITLPEGEFTTDLVTWRFNWTFTPKSFLQALTQYNSRSRQVGTNIRLAFLSTSSTGFFAVYNTRVATADYFDPHGTERRTQSRALFLKFNYLFDF
jgi:hypothetical protein